MDPTTKTKSDAISTYYDANYRNFQTELYSEIRPEAFGEDIGQNSWLTAGEHETFLSCLDLSTGKTALDVACGSGGPALRMAAHTGCSVVGIDLREDAISTAKPIAASAQRTRRILHCECDGAIALPGEWSAIIGKPLATPRD